MTLDPTRCNHLISHVVNGKVCSYQVAAIDCPHCLRHAILLLDELNADLLAALKAVVRIADRKTVEFDAAHAAIAKAESK